MEWVRPEVMVYGRTKRGLLAPPSVPSDSRDATTNFTSTRGADAGLCLDGTTDALNEQRHLVADLTDVSVFLG